MCGIVGSVSLGGGRPPSEETLRRMVARLPHRGPDETGVAIVGPAGFGHARLSIIDLSGGKQPMALGDAGLTLTFNGEIFNYVELRAELIRDHGRVFSTSSDTEVVLHAYAVWGDRCVARFNGQWALAIWDAPKKRLFASRDRLGVRPFFYTRTADALIFASEVKAIFAVPGVPRAIDPIGLDQILTFWSTVPPRTAFEGISELPAGHNLVLEGDGDVHLERYWALDYVPDESRSEASFAEELRATLIDAVRLRLRADVPVAAYLSGGIDSTVITSLIKKFTDSPLRTFSVTFDDPSYDESKWQEQVVRELGITEHSTVRATVDDIGRNFPAVVWHTEQPLIRTAPVPMYLLSGLVRRSGYKVVLTGEGADEMLGGYDIFKEAKVRRFWARQPGSTMRPKLLRKLYPYLPHLQAQSDEYLKAFFFARPDDLTNPFFSHMPRWDMTSKIKGLYAPAFRERLAAAQAGTDAYASLRDQLPARWGAWDSFSQSQWLESTMLLGGYLLSSQGDRVGMGNSIEGRFPFLDVRVAELAMKMPPTTKMKVLREKHILKVAMADLIPKFLQTRPKQPYRAVDVQAFFDTDAKKARFPWVDELLAPDAIEKSGLFHPGAVGKLADKARAGQIIGVKDGMALVAVLSAQLVHAQFVETLEKRSDVE